MSAIDRLDAHLQPWPWPPPQPQPSTLCTSCYFELCRSPIPARCQDPEHCPCSCKEPTP